MPQQQHSNEEMLRILSRRFRKLYSPVGAWGDIAGFVLSLPGLVGYWPGTVNRDTPRLIDTSGNGLALTPITNGAVAYATNLPLPTYLAMDGASAFSIVDDVRLSITGSETIIDPAFRGLTIAAWVYFDNTASAIETVISKWNTTGNQRSYGLHRRATGVVRFELSSNGTAETTVDSTAVVGQDTWAFVAGTWSDTNTDMTVWVNDEATTNSSAPGSVFDSTAAFYLGQESTTSNFLTGRIAHPFVTASWLSATHLLNYFEMTCPLFGVRP